MIDVATFDWMPPDEAAQLLIACCGARRWVDGMVVRRPFGDIHALLTAADQVWLAMGPDDWHEAFAHHPRLGEAKSAVAQDERARFWSNTEQSGARNADASLRAELASANAAYEERFGFICIICATGLDAREILTLTEERLLNELADEIRVASDEQRKITRLRLLKLFHDPDKAAAS
jgi:2-oxo-4-hydroxy-4-carboxy-5-ureidoimidazoline decarboxylase